MMAVATLRHDITYQMDIYRCFANDESIETARFHDVKNKALHSKRLSINVRHLSSASSGLQQIWRCKIKKNILNNKIFCEII